MKEKNILCWVNMKSKWKRDMKAMDDKHQTVFAPDTPTGVAKRQKTIVNIQIAHTGIYSCPFCLYQAKIEHFLISTKKGFHKGLGQCPDCQNKMRFRTLTAEWTPEDFAEWCYGYSADGYWQKVPFSKFSDRLYKIGWSKRFWDKYKQLKGEDKSEDYMTMLNKEASAQYDRDILGVEEE